MSAILALAWKSLMNRKGSVLLTLLAVALSVALFLGVDKARTGAREGFGNTISGTELIVGAPTGSVNLLLYSVFRMGSATAEISWPTYQEIAARPDVDWAVPISLGDSHRGFRVMGTTPDYFDHYKYGRNQDLLLAEGEQFEDLFDAVIGADVARELDYPLGSPMILSHGLGQADFGSGHENRPFRVVGILAPTGTPVDQTVHVSLEAITAIHVGWETGAKNPLADNIAEETILRPDAEDCHRHLPRPEAPGHNSHHTARDQYEPGRTADGDHPVTGARGALECDRDCRARPAGGLDICHRGGRRLHPHFHPDQPE